MHYKTEAPLAELFIGEIAVWDIGVCQIRAVDESGELVPGGMAVEPRYIVVRGENGSRLREIDLEEVSAEELDEQVNNAIEQEHNSL